MLNDLDEINSLKTLISVIPDFTNSAFVKSQDSFNQITDDKAWFRIIKHNHIK